MNTLYIIASEAQEHAESVQLLSAAAEERNVPLVLVHPETFDYSAVLTLEDGDMLYRARVGDQAALVERLLVHDGVATMYVDSSSVTRPLVDRPLALEKRGVPIVPTVHSVSRDRAQLDRSVEKLGGYPVIVKEIGGSHGVGVMKLDTPQSLYSVVDVLLGKGGRYIMRSYIEYKQHIRTIVLADKVIGAVEYPRVGNDFRSNVGDTIDVIPTDINEKIAAASVAAVQVYGLEFGGVDVLVDEAGSVFVAEANFPCFFPRVQLATNNDIAGAMIDHLVKKSELLVTKP